MKCATNNTGLKFKESWVRAQGKRLLVDLTVVLPNVKSFLVCYKNKASDTIISTVTLTTKPFSTTITLTQFWTYTRYHTLCTTVHAFLNHRLPWCITSTNFWCLVHYNFVPLHTATANMFFCITYKVLFSWNKEDTIISNVLV